MNMQRILPQHTSVGVVFLIASWSIFYALVTHVPTDPSFISATDTSSVSNGLGRFGAHLSALLVYFFGGIASLVLACGLAFFGYIIFRTSLLRDEWDRILSCITSVFAVAWLAAYYGTDMRGTTPGGFFGQQGVTWMQAPTNGMVMHLLVYMVLWTSVVIISRLSFLPIASMIGHVQWMVVLRKLGNVALIFAALVSRKARKTLKSFLVNEDEEEEISSDDLIWSTLEQLEAPLDGVRVLHDPFWYTLLNRSNPERAHSAGVQTIPHHHTPLQTSPLASSINAHVVTDSSWKVPLILGSTPLGVPVIIDGTTALHIMIQEHGPAPSAVFNSALMSLINKPSQELRMVLIDAEIPEFTLYHDIPHLALPVVINPREAPQVLRWVLNTVEERYELLSALGMSHISDYKAWCREHGAPDAMPFIVVMMAELAEIMGGARDEIENLLAGIASRATAVGIHLIIATREPLDDLITSATAAYFPSRITKNACSMPNSSTVLEVDESIMTYRAPDGSITLLQSIKMNRQEVIAMVQQVKRAWITTYLLTFTDLQDRDSVVP